MKSQKLYEATDKMVSIIRDNYNILQTMSAFGITLGFGDKTVAQVCKAQKVDTFTFLTVINYTVNGIINEEEINKLDVPTLMRYLEASHAYYLDFQLPFIRRELSESLSADQGVGELILRLYDEYARSITTHMRYEEKNLFPYVEELLDGQSPTDYNIETFSKHHRQTDQKLRELKNIIIKYVPTDLHHNNQLMATLYDIYNNEEWLTLHGEVEDNIFIPAIRRLEKKTQQNDVARQITKMISQGNSDEELSDREKDIIICVVQGLSNKEIADKLSIATSTVITHRRNIARKLQIHSPAGLTIYAIVNHLVDLSTVKL